MGLKSIAKNVLSSLGYEISSRAVAGVPPQPVVEVCATLDVPVLECMSREEYAKYCSPLFPSYTAVPASWSFEGYESVAAAVCNSSMRVYFSIEQDPLRITDAHEGSHYHSRQRMLSTVYQRLAGDSLQGHSVLDIGCSSGYYSLFCSRLKADSVTGIDARVEHQDQFSLLQGMLDLPDTCRYRNIDMEFELETLNESFDVVLAQGVMYHVYDHPRFLKNLFRLTDRFLILEGGCSGRADRLCKPDLEEPENLRASIHGPVLYPSLMWMIELLRWAGFREVAYVKLPPDIPDDWGFDGLWRAMVVASK